MTLAYSSNKELLDARLSIYIYQFIKDKIQIFFMGWSLNIINIKLEKYIFYSNFIQCLNIFVRHFSTEVGDLNICPNN